MKDNARIKGQLDQLRRDLQLLLGKQKCEFQWTSSKIIIEIFDDRQQLEHCIMIECAEGLSVKYFFKEECRRKIIPWTEYDIVFAKLFEFFVENKLSPNEQAYNFIASKKESNTEINEVLYRPLLSFCWNFRDEIGFLSPLYNSMTNFPNFHEKMIRDPNTLLSKSENSVEKFFKNEAGNFVHELNLEDSEINNWLSILIREKYDLKNKCFASFKMTDHTSRSGGEDMIEILVPDQQFKYLKIIVDRTTKEKNFSAEDQQRSWKLKRVFFNYKILIEFEQLNEFLKSVNCEMTLPLSLNLKMLSSQDAFLRKCVPMLKSLFSSVNFEEFKQVFNYRKIFAVFIDHLSVNAKDMTLLQKFLVFIFQIVVDFLTLFDYLSNVLNCRESLTSWGLNLENLNPKVFTLVLRKKLESLISSSIDSPNDSILNEFKIKALIMSDVAKSSPMNFFHTFLKKNSEFEVTEQLYQLLNYLFQNKSFIPGLLLRQILDLRIHLNYIERVLRSLYTNHSFVGEVKASLVDLRVSEYCKDQQKAHQTQLLERDRKSFLRINCKTCKTSIEGLAIICLSTMFIKHKFARGECTKSDVRRKDSSLK